MKRFLALLLTLVLCLSLCACGKGGNEGSSAAGGSESFVKPENYASVLVVSINPEIKLYLDKDNNVLAVEPVNDDAKAVVEKLDVKNKKIDAAVRNIITVSKDEGFVKEGVTVSLKVAEVKDTAVSADTIADLAKQSTNETLTELKITAEVKTEKVGYTHSDPVNKDPNHNNSEHHHEFSKATCTEPAKCACGETQGKTAPHHYVSGVCTVCKAADPNALAAEKEKKNPIRNLKKGKEYCFFKPDAEEIMLTEFSITFNADGSYGYGKAPYSLDEFGDGESISYKGKTYYKSGGGGGGGGTYTLTSETITLAGSYDIVLTMTTDGKLVVKKADSTSDFFKVGDTFVLK